MNIIVFASKTGTNFKALLEFSKAVIPEKTRLQEPVMPAVPDLRQNDSIVMNANSPYRSDFRQNDNLLDYRIHGNDKSNVVSKIQIRALFCDRECKARDIALQFNIPIIYYSYAKFCETNRLNKNAEITREKFDRAVIKILQEYAGQFNFSIDLIVFAGYFRIVTNAFLTAFSHRVISVHPADLSRTDAHGRRIYTGANAVRDALVNQESQTRSTVHMVDDKVDTGSILAFGPFVQYKGKNPPTSQCIDAHQAKQKQQSDWPALIATVSSLASGKTLKDLCQEPLCVEYLLS